MQLIQKLMSLVKLEITVLAWIGAIVKIIVGSINGARQIDRIS